MKLPDSRAERLGEHAIIRRILERLPPAPSDLLVGPGDDAAVWAPPRGALQVLTTDALVEGVHFNWRFSSPADVGYRALAVNVSDVAAMGGRPHLALLSLILPADVSAAVVDGVVDGLLEMAAESGVSVAGGNISRGPGPMGIDLAVVGSVKPRRVLRRSGARPGDGVFVTGGLGAAAAGLAWLEASAGSGALSPGGGPASGALADCVARYRRPVPRSRIGALLGQTRTASACMDLSDGFADAVRQVAGASGAGIRLERAALPIHQGARDWCASHGLDPVAFSAASDDYELLFTVSRRRMGRLRGVVREARGVGITRVGEVTEERSLVISGPEGDSTLPAGFEHTP